MATISIALRALLGVVFAWSAAGKVTPAGFAAAVTMLREIGVRTRTRLVAGLLVGAEVITVVLLAVPGTVRAGTVAAVVMLGVLTAGVAVVVRRGLAVRCACFGATASPLGVTHLVRNAVLLACAGAEALSTASGANFAAGLVAAITGAVLAVLIVRLDDLEYLIRTPI